MSHDESSIGNGVDASTSEDAEVARVLDEYLAALEAGRPADPGRLLAEHPAIASQLRACLEVMHLAGRVAGCGEAAPDEEDDAPLGPRLADYRIVRQIGRGGMGIVYEAEQLSLRRRVALKVLPLASAIDPRQLRRFHVEAQAAAQLHHTHIVPVYAVGCERGVHYYAMQYIEGKTLAQLIRELRRLANREAVEETLTAVLGGDLDFASMLASGQFAPAEKLPAADAPVARPTSSRRPATGAMHSSGSSTRTSAYFRTVANLGIQAAEALEHAHQEGVVHRDIKPANVMVDVKGHLWITDFGLARLQNDSGLTLSGDLVGTIRYMSPEQAIGHRAVVDHRTDIYELGVTLYELVALEPAFDGSDHREVLRRIIEEEPRSLRALDPAVPRELETIIQKAMAKEPESRYLMAQELADDLRRFLEYRPIKARRPTLLERAAKWSRRHRSLVTMAALLLVLGTAVSTWEAIRATRAERAVQKQRDRAETQASIAKAVNEFLLNDLLAEAAPDKNARDRKVTVEEVLDKAASRVASKFVGQPEVEAAIRHTLGETYDALGLSSEAKLHLERALELRRRVLGADHPDTLSTMNDLAPQYGDEALRRQLEDCRRALGPEHHETLVAMNNLANLYHAQGRYGQAEPLRRQVLEASLRALGPEHHETLAAMNNLAMLYWDHGRHKQAEALLQQALEVNRRTNGPDHPNTLQMLTNLAEFYEDLHRYQQAEPLLRQALEADRRVLGPEHPGTVGSMRALARLYHEERRYEPAESLFQQALEVSRRVNGPEGAPTLAIMDDVAKLYQEQGRYERAEPLFRQALEASRRIHGVDHHNTLTGMDNLARLYRAQGRYEEAEPLFRQALEASRRAFGPEHPDTLKVMNALARLRQAQGRYEQAELLLRQTLEACLRVHGAEYPGTLQVMKNLAGLYRHQGRYEQAEPLLRRTLEASGRALGPEHPETLGAMLDLAELYGDQGWYERAEPLFRQVMEASRRVHGPEDINTLVAMNNLAGMYQAQDKPAEAESLSRQALELGRSKLGRRHPLVANLMAELGNSLLKQRKYAEAEPALRECLAIREEVEPDDWVRSGSQSLLGASLLGQERYAEAESLLLSGYEGMKAREDRIPAADKSELTEAGERVVQLYAEWGQPEKAAESRARLSPVVAELPADVFARP